ncbi:hypothetical protein SAICODRAFT_7167 [Saitoella complicata NRRL Y-17804]|uniref:uncharacterized protein n=1 Tax=Saitoella complicata (strain BCRC 22490 / CBS 7301 / JCM 7358 / NBRC 10748 / NRRL Y-17804) TaxID=698492 RepID=UPI0008670F01|nr:uncharacterized protein SAICODRAFT_7167 [Saitoella complicata NRRL Y-17804]ODQ53453.1 hypothetical protein SAICODRAFT_7167 [Saitoella complicata NRRL Y-17804]
MFARSRIQFARSHGVRSFFSFGEKRPSNALVKPSFWKRTKQHPSTPFIILWGIVGSQAIHLITIRNFHKDLTAKGNARISALRDVLERLKQGEEVDVKKELGAGVHHVEQEWTDILKNIEEEEREWQRKAEEIRSRKASESTNSAVKQTTQAQPAETSRGKTQLVF